MDKIQVLNLKNEKNINTIKDLAHSLTKEKINIEKLLTLNFSLYEKINENNLNEENLSNFIKDGIMKKVEEEFRNHFDGRYMDFFKKIKEEISGCKVENLVEKTEKALKDFFKENSNYIKFAFEEEKVNEFIKNIKDFVNTFANKINEIIRKNNVDKKADENDLKKIKEDFDKNIKNKILAEEEDLRKEDLGKSIKNAILLKAEETFTKSWIFSGSGAGHYVQPYFFEKISDKIYNCKTENLVEEMENFLISFMTEKNSLDLIIFETESYKFIKEIKDMYTEFVRKKIEYDNLRAPITKENFHNFKRQLVLQKAEEEFRWIYFGGHYLFYNCLVKIQSEIANCTIENLVEKAEQTLRNFYKENISRNQNILHLSKLLEKSIQKFLNSIKDINNISIEEIEILEKKELKN